MQHEKHSRAGVVHDAPKRKGFAQAKLRVASPQRCARQAVAAVGETSPKALRILLTLVLCLSMVPGLATPDTALASTYYSHGTISVSSPDAVTTSGTPTIELEVGQQASIDVYPYQHVQYKGCCMDRCLDYGCDDMSQYVGQCFTKGLGCCCDAAPTLRETVANLSFDGPQIVTASSMTTPARLTASTSTLGQMNTGTITLTATEPGETKLTVAASMEDFGMWNGSTVTYTVKVTDSNAGTGDDDSDVVSGDTTITKGGTYSFATNLTGATVSVDTTEPVEFVGNGIGGGAVNYVTIDSVVAGANITLNGVVMYNANEQAVNSLNFTGEGNTLTLKGQNQLQVCYNNDGCKALIRVPKSASLTINGDGELYMYKHSYNAAAIGGDKDEACGDITLDGPSIYATGVNGGCIVGGESMTQASGKFVLRSGELAASPAKYQPTLCGFSSVELNGGILSVDMGSTTDVAPAIASYDGAGAGTVVYNGGLIRMQPSSNFDVASVDSKGAATLPLFIKPAEVAGAASAQMVRSAASSYVITLDGKQVYDGDMCVSLHKSSGNDPYASNPDTWPKALSTEYYMLVTPESHVVTVNGTPLYVTYTEEDGFITSLEEPSQEGTGEPAFVDGFYQIANEAQLRWFAEAASKDPSLNAALTADIELSDGVLPNLAPLATSVSNAGKGFTGTFDGAGHAISGIAGFANASIPGFVGMLSGGTIKNLTLKGAGQPITVSGNAGMFAVAAYGGTIENCINEVSLSGAKSMGGIIYTAAYNKTYSISKTVTIAGCVNRGDLSSTYTSGFVGGIVAYANMANDAAAISVGRCVNEGDISACNIGGGIVGKNGGVLAISESCNLGSLSDGVKRTSTQTMNIGGLVGCQQSTRAASLADCYSSGSVSVALSTSTNAFAGGLIGYAQTGSPSVDNCFASGTVSTFDGFAGYSGTFVGYAQTISYIPVVKNGYYLEGAGNGAMSGADLDGAASVTADELLCLADALNADREDGPFVDDAATGHPVFSWQLHEGAPALKVPDASIATTSLKLRHTGNGDSEPSWAALSLEGADAEWTAAVTSVKVTSPDDGSYSVEVARAAETGTKPVGGTFSFDSDEAPTKLTVGRTVSNPVFVVNPGEGMPFDVKGMRGTTTYPQSRVYTVTVEADGYEPVSADVTFYTGASKDFTIWVDEGDGELREVWSFTADDIDGLSSFANGSSQCGMTGFRTFSAVGVSVADLLDYAGVDYSEDDAFKLQTTDNFGATFTYDQLFGERYFLQSVYDDPEVKELYDRLSSDASAGSDTELRRLLAEKAQASDTRAYPMISANYAETMISGEQVGNTPVPTEESTFVDGLVGAENRYRFTYGIALVQEDETVTFVTGEGADQVEPQMVKSHLMTSTENTTIKSTYWNNGIIIYRGQGSAPEESAAAAAIAKPADPTREGYEFAGWYTDEACTDGNEFDFEANDGTVDADTTLYAKWVEAEKTPALVDGFYQITNEDELRWFAEKSHDDPTLNAALTVDIALADAMLPYLGGTSTSTGFAGTFDGQGHAITGVLGFRYGNAPGLVPYLCGGTVKNLALEGEVTGIKASAGAFVANASKGGTVENCTNRVAMAFDPSSTLSTCSIGGIVGVSNNALDTELKVVGCVNEAPLSTGKQRAAGIVGTNTGRGTLVIERCRNTASVTSSQGIAAGILGSSETSAKIVRISECSNAGAVAGGGAYSYAGGILASAAVGTISIADCYNAGAVSRNADNGAAAGIVGNSNCSPTVANCFNAGAVTCSANDQSTNVHAVAGGAKASISNSYYLEGQNNTYENAAAKTAQELLYLADALNAGRENGPFANDAATGHPVFSWQPHEEPAPLPQSFSITYVLGADDAVNAESNPAAYTEGDEVAFADPTREGYEFAGWFADEALTQQVTGISADQTGDVTLYAKWLDYGTISVALSNGEEGYQYVATSMGRNPAAQVGYDLLASFDGTDEMEQAQQVERMQAWIDAIDRVTIGEGDGAVVLENKALADWMGEISDPATDVLNYYSLDEASVKTVLDPETHTYSKVVGSKVYVPIQLFGSDEYSTLKITFSAEGYEDMTGEMVYRNLGATQLVVRVKDSADAEASYSYTLSMDDLKSLPVQSKVETSANCGMAGLRSYMSEGVALTDVLKAAGVEFGPGMALAVRVTDKSTTNDGNGGADDAYHVTFDYETLMGVDRYHYPAMWDDITTYDELDGKTIYDVISSNHRAWKYGANDTLKKLLATGAQKVESPIIAWAWNEGVVGWDGTNPATQTWGGNTYNPYTSHETFRFLYGMTMDADGSIADDNTTMYNTYGVFGIDVIANGQTAVDGSFNVTGIEFGLPDGTDLDEPFDTAAALRDIRMGYTVTLPTATSSDANTAFEGWYLGGKRVTTLSKADLEGFSGVVTLGSSWKVTTPVPTPTPGDSGDGSQQPANPGIATPQTPQTQIVYVQGPQGATGATGARGPQGPAGASAAPATATVPVAEPTAPAADATATAAADKSAVLGERDKAVEIDDGAPPLAASAGVDSNNGFVWWDLWPLYLAILCAAGIVAAGFVLGRKRKEDEKSHQH